MNRFNKSLLFAFIIVIIGTIIGFLFSYSGIFVPELPDICETWNKNYVMEMSLFLTGFISYWIFKTITDYQKRL